MSYHIYTTKGIVLGQVPRREADRLYTIFTRDFGLVRASASGVRKEVSKLRGNLEPFSIANVSLVKGKGEWRITSAELIKKVSLRRNIARVFNLVERLAGAEVTHPEIFDLLENAYDGDDSEELEVFLVAQILFELGYLLREYVPRSLDDVRRDKKAIVKAINSGLQESGLT